MFSKLEENIWFKFFLEKWCIVTPLKMENEKYKSILAFILKNSLLSVCDIVWITVFLLSYFLPIQFLLVILVLSIRIILSLSKVQFWFNFYNLGNHKKCTFLYVYNWYLTKIGDGADVQYCKLSTWCLNVAIYFLILQNFSF